ncbi:MAG: hypothetical protein H8D46_03370, partial [FCB group bacterium]|nr:hypothetical protein [FCB group bacterium]
MRDKYLKLLAGYSVQYTWRMSLILLALTVLLLALASRLSVNPGMTEMLPENNLKADEFQHILEEFDNASSIILLVKGSPESMKAYAEHVAPRIESFTTWVERVDMGIPEDFYRNNGLKLLSLSELENFEDLFRDPNLIPFLENLNDSFEKEYRADNSLSSKKKEQDAVRFLDGIQSFSDAVYQLFTGNDPGGLGAAAADAITIGETFFLSPDRKMMLITIEPTFNMFDDINLVVDDEVMAGSLMAEGCGQLLQFFLLYVGMHTKTKDARFQPIWNLPQNVRCRGQVTPKDRLLTYRMEIKEIGLEPHPYAMADIDILLDDKIVVDFKSLGVQMVEKREDDPYKVVVPEEKTASVAVAKKTRAHKKQPLFDRYHLEHFATGSLSECFGPEFAIYKGRVAPRTPNTDLQLTSRVTHISGERHDFSKPAYAIAEYDVPEDAWYYTNNSHGAVMPYAVIMEIALQPCGFISAYMGTTLLYPETDFFFRNLDGRGKLHRDIDLRGKTIENKATLLTTAAMGNTIIQTFEFEMTVGEDLYYSGTAAFGYFVAAALADQIGLDNGIDNHPMTERKYLKDAVVSHIDLKAVEAKKKYYKSRSGKPCYRLAGPQLDLLDTVQIVADGGKKGLGYIYADRKIDEKDWYFKCHFYQDPVMPGSLGVESAMQALEVLALPQHLGKALTSPSFPQLPDPTTPTYPGHLAPALHATAIAPHITT